MTFRGQVGRGRALNTTYRTCFPLTSSTYPRRDDLDARFPGLLDAVLGAAVATDTGADAGLADDAPSA
jgi:hypothetical protein